MGVVEERLGVEVDLAVGRVLEAVEALARRRVRALGDDRDFVLGEQVGQRNPVPDDASGVDLASVEDDRLDPRRENLDVRAGARLATTKARSGDRPEALGASREVELDVVRVHVDETRPLGGLVLGDDMHRCIVRHARHVGIAVARDELQRPSHASPPARCAPDSAEAAGCEDSAHVFGGTHGQVRTRVHRGDHRRDLHRGAVRSGALLTIAFSLAGRGAPGSGAVTATDSPPAGSRESRG